MTYKHQEKREIPGYGVFKPGDTVEYDEILFKSGLFDKKDTKKKTGDK